MTSSEDMRQAFLAHRREHGQASALKIIKSVAGVDDVSAVPEERRADVMEALSAAPDANPMLGADGSLDVGAIYAKWNGASRRRPE
jgi:hypothetical protein